jgi:hypothetical protein
MRKQPELTELIQPFNMADSVERETMYNAKPMESITMGIFLVIYAQPCASGGGNPLGRGDWDWQQDGDLAEVIRDIAMRCIAASEFPNMDCEVIVREEDHDGFAEMDWVPTDDIQRDWSLDGMVPLQLGFKKSYRWSALPDPVNAIYAAMTTYDRMYIESGTLDPKNHTPIPASEAESQAYRLVVNDLYREGIAVWSRDLMALRNEVMVKARAQLYGDDPEVEWNRFLNAGFVHYLDYLRIWQPPEL